MVGNDKEWLIDDLNVILKDNFDYVPIGKVIDIAEKLIAKGWKLSNVIRGCCDEPEEDWCDSFLKKQNQ